MQYFSEAVFPPDYNMIRRKATVVELLKREGVRLIDLLRRDIFFRRDRSNVFFEVGDYLVLHTQITE